ncbi:MAG: hypothetical protein ACREDR_32040, partial [Blastocatellia bacterium]
MRTLLMILTVLALCGNAWATPTSDIDDSGLVVVRAACRGGAPHRTIPTIVFNAIPWQVRSDVSRELREGEASL